MATYVLKKGKWVCKKTGKPMITEAEKQRFSVMLEKGLTPMINSEIPDYQSPVTGEWVSGRAARREDLKKHGCHEVDPPSKPLRERSRRVAKAPKIQESRELNEKLDAIANREGIR